MTSIRSDSTAYLTESTRRVAVRSGVVEYAANGQGPPVIVLESGLGDDLTSWRSVFCSLAERGRTVAYSRAGLGASTSSPGSRDLATESQELWELLRMLGEQPPFLLVGHSWGGLIVQALAAQHPEQIAGMVLVDSAHPDLIERLHHDTPDDAQVFDRLAQEIYGSAAKQELEALSAPQGGHFAGEDQPYSGPMVILAAWMFDFNQSILYREQHRRRAEEIGARYPQAEIRRIHCAHRIQEERPLAVIEAVDEVLARARSA